MTEPTHRFGVGDDLKGLIRAAIREVYANLDNSGHYGHRPSADKLTAKIVAGLEKAHQMRGPGVGDDGA